MMKRIRSIAVAAAVLCAGGYAPGDVTPQDVTRLLGEIPAHPYLYFTAESKGVILDRIQADPECRAIYARLLAEGRRLLHTPVAGDPPKQNPRAGFTRSDDRLAWLRAHRRKALELAFLYQMTGDRAFAEKAFEFADAVCDLPTWVDRRHQFPIIYSRVWPWNVDDDQAAFAVDIETTETARILAAVYDWLYPALAKRRRDRIRGALLEKAVLPVRGGYEYHWWAASYRCNWCACCNGGLGTASVALLDSDPQLADVIAESYNRISRQFDEIGVDGGWREGCGYYRKSIHAVNFFADPLKRLTGGELDLYAHPRVRENPVTFLLYNTVTPRRLIPFEDSSYYRAGTSHIWNKLAAETGSPETAWFRNYMWGEGRDIFDIIWPRAPVEPSLPKKTSIHFRTIDWAVMRNSFTDPDDVVVACKAGMNDDPHHGHLDVGHFIVYWRSQEYICDTGSPEYDEFFFDEKRWDYPQASSVGHNVVFVDGELQIPAKRKNTPWREGVGGKILEFRDGGAIDYTLIDATGAYPGRKLKGWRRHIILLKPDVTVLLDEVNADSGAEIETRFHSRAKTQVLDRHVLLTGDGGTMTLAPAVEGGFSFREGKHPSLPVIENARFEFVPFFGTVVKAADAATLIGTVICPVDGKPGADALARSVVLKRDSSGGAMLSFRRNGKTVSCRFTRTDAGLLLESR